MVRGIDPHLPDTTHCQLTFLVSTDQTEPLTPRKKAFVSEIKRVLGRETSEDSALQGWWRGSRVFADWSELHTMNPKISKHALFSLFPTGAMQETRA